MKISQYLSCVDAMNLCVKLKAMFPARHDLVIRANGGKWYVAAKADAGAILRNWSERLLELPR